MAGEYSGEVFVDGKYIPWDENEMEFLNVEEDFDGRDKITFKYKGKTYKSAVIARRYSPFEDTPEYHESCA